MTHEEIYRRSLLEALHEIEQVCSNLHTVILNLAMAGEWQEIDNLFEVGESFLPKEGDFRTISDINVKSLFGIVDQLSDTYRSIKNINGIKKKEIERFTAGLTDDNELPF